MAENADFSVEALLEKANITRAEFRAHFRGKMDLVSALAEDKVPQPHVTPDAAEPVAVIPSAPVEAAPDLMSAAEEIPVDVNLAALAAEAWATVALEEIPVEVNVSEVAKATPVPVAEEIAADEWLERRLRVFERALATMEKRQEKFEQDVAHVLALLEEQMARQRLNAPIQNEAPPLVDMLGPSNSLRDFMTAYAREAANAAVNAEAAPSEVRKTPWLAWGGAAAALVLVAAGGFGLVLAGQNESFAAPLPAGSETHRHVAQNGLPKMMALADSGNSAAQAGLAMAYLRGNGVAQDDAAAMRWSQAAAAQGQPVAEYLLGTLYLEGNRDQAQAVRWFQSAAGQGNVKAMHNLAIAYAQGLGVEKNEAEAATWFVRAASSGYCDSQFDLAVLYERGLGVPQDSAAALKWYLIAANHGDAPSAQRAQFLITQMDVAEIKAATDAAAAFAPEPVEKSANDVTL